MATFTKRIDADIRDVGYSGATPFQSSALSLGNPGAVVREISLRFIGVTIPQGATISSAKITFTGSDVRASQTINMKVYGVDEDNTAEFVISPEDTAKTRTHTSASVDWDATISTTDGSTHDTSDITSIVKEIVDRGSWSSGNAMAFHVGDDGSGSGHYINVYEYNSSTTKCALLTIVYVAASVSLSPSASFSATLSESFSPSVSPSITPSASISLSPSGSISLSPSGSISASPSLSVSPSPSPHPPFFGLKIAKSGFNVLEETDPNKLIFSSEYNTLKYYKSGTITHSVSEADNTLYRTKSYYTHDLNFYPYFEVYCKDNLMSGWQPVGKFQAGAGAYRSFYAYVTKTKLYVVASGYTGIGGAGEAYDVVFYYKIFRNNLGL